MSGERVGGKGKGFGREGEGRRMVGLYGEINFFGRLFGEGLFRINCVGPASILYVRFETLSLLHLFWVGMDLAWLFNDG